MNLTEQIECYLVELKATRYYAKTTSNDLLFILRAYARQYARFDQESLQNYVIAMVEQELTGRTIHSRINALRQFGRWLVAQGHLPGPPEQNPAYLVKTPPIGQSERRTAPLMLVRLFQNAASVPVYPQ